MSSNDSRSLETAETGGDDDGLGGPVDRVKVSLRLFGDDLDPDEITTLLGASPTMSHRRGDLIRSRHVAPTGGWLLYGDTDEGDDLADQVEALLARVSSDLEVWAHLASRFDVDVFCGLFMEDTNRGFALPPSVMSALAARHLLIDFDIYC